MPTVIVQYQVEMDQKVADQIESEARELGYSYQDAGQLETIRRYLRDEGLTTVFPEQKYSTTTKPLRRVDGGLTLQSNVFVVTQ